MGQRDVGMRSLDINSAFSRCIMDIFFHKKKKKKKDH